MFVSKGREQMMNVQGEDRLSTLPDDLIYKILSSIDIKHVIQTSVLSSRWRFVWTSTPYLNFSSYDFFGLRRPSKCITHVLSGRNNQADVSSVELSFHGKDTYAFVQQIMEYAFSHNIQQLNIACLFDDYDVEFPLFLSSSRSLKHLTMSKDDFSAKSYIRKRSYTYVIKSTSRWEFPALTTLHLHDVKLCGDETSDKCIDFFSECANLTNLTLKGCKTKGFKGLSLCLPLLSNLTLENVDGSVQVINIVAPQLKNLTIRSFLHGFQDAQNHQYLLSASDLAFLLYKGYCCFQLSTNGFLSLEKADICVRIPKDPHQVLRMLQQIHNVKYLTLNLEIVEFLSSSVELMSHQPSPFANLKRLKIHPSSEYSRVGKHNRGKISAQVKSYLLDGSPCAIVTIISREDVIAMRNTRHAQYLTRKLMVRLEEERSNIETIMTDICEEKKKQVDEDELTIADWNYLTTQTDDWVKKHSGIISTLTEIKEQLGKLSASNRATIQPSFSMLCAVADTIMNKMTEIMKMHIDENQRRLSARCHDLATSVHLTS